MANTENGMAALNESADAKLVILSQAGDRRAFEGLVRTHERQAYSLAYRFMGNDDDARDVVQEVFLRIWTRIQRVDPLRKFARWLNRVVANACLDRIRGYRRREVLPFDGDPPAGFFPSPNPAGQEGAHLRREYFDLVIGLARRLPPRQQAVFVLRDLQDLELGEISGILRMSSGSVKSNLCRARRSIRTWLLELETIGRRDHDL